MASALKQLTNNKNKLKKLGRIPSVILILIFINFAGLTLKYFELTDYIIFIGFRFHLGLAVPFLIYFLFAKETHIKEYFISPELKNLRVILLVGLAPIIIEAFLLLLSIAEIGDPLYFYEFGLTSIIDFPIYFIWNLPQLLLFVLFLLNIIDNRKSIWPASIIFFLMFIYQGINLEESIVINYPALIFLFSSALLILGTLAYFDNIIEITAALFFILWGAILINGSTSQLLINIFFAKNYSKWEGFLQWPDMPAWIILSSHIFICSILFLIFRKKRSDSATFDNNVKNEYNKATDVPTNDI